MLGGIDIPLWAVALGVFVWALPILLAITIIIWGEKLGKYKFLFAALVFVGGYILLNS